MRFSLRFVLLVAPLFACAPAQTGSAPNVAPPAAPTNVPAPPSPQDEAMGTDPRSGAPSQASPTDITFVIADADTPREAGAPIVIHATRGTSTTRHELAAVSSSEHVAIEASGPVRGSDDRLFVVWLAESRGEDCREEALQVLFLGSSPDGALRTRGAASVGVDRNAFDAARDALDAQLVLEGDTVRIDTTLERTCALLDRDDPVRDMMRRCELPELGARCRPFVRRASQTITLAP